METKEVPASEAAQLQRVLDAMNAGTLKIGPEFHSIKAKPGAMLVDMINSDPYVFVPPATVHVFESRPGSGTDHLRQRTLADQFFDALAPDQQQAPMKKVRSGSAMGI